MTLHHCRDGGYVVAADVAIPEDPGDYQAGAAILGCSNLRCTRCGEAVRQRAGVASMRDHNRAIDVDAVRAMDPAHQEWAIAMIVAAAAHPDPRSRVALEALEVHWGLDALKTLPC